MLRANEVMTHALATCEADTCITDVAAIMRDRDIGNVLVVEDGKLQGIVTDRDLALQALTGMDDPLVTPIRKFMSTDVITGESTWNLEQVAKVMGKHQIRRLPIIQDGQLVGIVSLGDLARLEERKKVVANSLQAISKPVGISAPGRSKNNGAFIGIVLTALTATAVAWLTWNNSGKAIRKKVAKGKLYHTAQDVVGVAREKVDSAVSSKKVKELRQHMGSNIKGITAKLPTLEYKPPKRKSIWFA
ncbi:MAG: hypothetical protein CVU39_11950 [Chloroflexi bacterium HGW-Chloroflexi-10]|nr:MAG: hypothetical protein CVU39_11950 [Chloroflexi bacterium HGW-Chloroflexi-10]